MINGNNNKNKIDLNSYNYQEDIQHRLFLGSLTSFELETLIAVVHSSLQTSVESIAKEMHQPVTTDLKDALEHLATSGLLTINGPRVEVNKEKRRYFESSVDRLEEDFQSDLRYFRTLLSKLPIERLMLWYHIHADANEIIQEVIRQHLATPQIFQRYFKEIEFQDPLFHELIHAVYESENLEIPVKDLKKHFSLSAESFEEYVLHLEFNLLLCEHFSKKENGEWCEVLTPFHEWKEYLLLKKQAFPLSLDDKLVKNIQSHPKDSKELIASMLIHDQYNRKTLVPEASEKALRDIERHLIILKDRGWVLLEEFLEKLYIPLYVGDEIRLESKGKRLYYTIPSYTPEEKKMLEPLFKERFLASGLIELGEANGKPAIRLLHPPL